MWRRLRLILFVLGALILGGVWLIGSAAGHDREVFEQLSGALAAGLVVAGILMSAEGAAFLLRPKR